MFLSTYIHTYIHTNIVLLFKDWAENETSNLINIIIKQNKKELQRNEKMAVVIKE